MGAGGYFFSGTWCGVVAAVGGLSSRVHAGVDGAGDGDGVEDGCGVGVVDLGVIDGAIELV